MGWIDELIPEELPRMIRSGKLFVPSLYNWDTTLVGDGAVLQQPATIRCRTGTTANSSCIASCDVFGWNPASAGIDRISWDKKIYMYFTYGRDGNDANAVGRIQLKETSAIGALGALGIGLRCDNLALTGESYGTELGTVDLNTTMTISRPYRILIVHTPATKIEWYVEGVLVGTQTTTAKIPSGAAGAGSKFAHSLLKGNEGVKDDYGYMISPVLWKAV